MKNVEIQLGYHVFPTKKAALERMRRVLHTASLNEALMGEDLELVWHLLLRHHDAAVKIGPGVSAISVQSPPGYYGQRCFWLHRIDGVGVDFSIHVALRGRPDQRDDVLTALRNAIIDQVRATRAHVFMIHSDSYGRITCPVSGVLVTQDECDVDHWPIPFLALATMFVNAQGGWDTVRVIDGPNGLSGVLADELIRDAWCEYHRVAATLRVISRQAHVRRVEPP